MKLPKKNGKEIKSNTPASHPSGWSKVKTLAIAGILGLFSSCDNVPNDKIILNPDEGSEKFSIEYHYSGGGSGEPTVVDYNIFVTKNGDIYKGKIEQKDGFFSETVEIESNNIDKLYNEISNKLDSERISESTTDKKNEKVDFAKQTYKDYVLNNKRFSKGKKSSEGEITIKYE